MVPLEELVQYSTVRLVGLVELVLLEGLVGLVGLLSLVGIVGRQGLLRRLASPVATCATRLSQNCY